MLVVGVLWHGRSRVLALERLGRLDREYAVVETHYIKAGKQQLLRFCPGGSLNQDPTNFWGPTLSCVDLMLKDVGFRKVSLLRTYTHGDSRAIFLARK